MLDAKASLTELSATDHRLPLYARLRDIFVRRIAAGEWRPSAPLPSESTLARVYDVSVGTMRKALAELAEEGLLERRHGSGTFVRRARLERSLLHAFHGGACARDGDAGDRHSGACAREMRPTVRLISREAVAAAVGDQAALAIDRDARVIAIERLHLAGDRPFLAETIVLPFAPFAALMAREPRDLEHELYPLYETACGRLIAKVEEKLTVAAANGATAHALACRRGAPVVIIERRAFGHDGQPLEWRRCRGHAEHFSYRLEAR
jgi:GntR family transcriptional regulator